MAHLFKFLPNDHGSPPGKLCDVEMHFVPTHDVTACVPVPNTHDALIGLKLIGFAIWERRGGGGRNVTFPARSYSVNGERRSFALLRPVVDSEAQDRLRQSILDAYDAWIADQALDRTA